MKLIAGLVLLALLTAGVHAQSGMTPAEAKRNKAWLADTVRRDRIAAKDLDRRFSLSQRKKMAYTLAHMQDLARPSNATDEANTRFGRRYHITYDEVIHLMVESSDGNWPMPPDPSQ